MLLFTGCLHVIMFITIVRIYCFLVKMKINILSYNPSTCFWVLENGWVKKVLKLPWQSCSLIVTILSSQRPWSKPKALIYYKKKSRVCRRYSVYVLDLSCASLTYHHDSLLPPGPVMSSLTLAGWFGNQRSAVDYTTLLELCNGHAAFSSLGC